MKVGIVGSGLVGATAAYALIARGIGREIVLVNRNMKRAQAEADDLYHAVPFTEPLEITAGDYPALAGSKVVIIAAGVNQQPGETRLQLLGRNAAIFRTIVPQVLAHAPDAILVVATNPVDVMTHLAARYAGEQGVPSSHILGSGTTLDTARFRSLLARHLSVDSHNIHGYVVGEHGDSEVLVWSRVTVGGIPLAEFCSDQPNAIDDSMRQEIDHNVRNAAYHIISGKGATYYGIGSALARIVDVIFHDQRAILTVCAPHEEVAGVQNVTLSMPHLLGGEGILYTLPLPLDDGEEVQLHNSAKIIRQALDELDEATKQ